MIFKNVGTVMPVWNLHRVDPGFIYIVENHGKYKIGKSKRARIRLSAAKTWLPDMKLVGHKPFGDVSPRTLFPYWFCQILVFGRMV